MDFGLRQTELKLRLCWLITWDLDQVTCVSELHLSPILNGYNTSNLIELLR